MIIAVHPYICLSMMLSLSTLLHGFQTFLLRAFPFARLLQQYVDFMPWARDQKVKWVFCPLHYVLLHYCVEDLKVIGCLPSCSWPQWLSLMRVQLVIRRLWV